MVFEVLLLWIFSCLLVVHGETCSGNDQSQLSTVVFVNQFFTCYDSNRATVGSCFESAIGLSATCSGCIQTAADCLNSTCTPACNASPRTPGCVSCATTNCEPTLKTCTALPLTFDPCLSFFCNQPSWVLPVIIAGSVLGFIVLLVLVYCLLRRFRNDESCSCSCSCGRVCCDTQLNEDERLEERLRRQNQERIEKLNRTRESSGQTLAMYSRKAEAAKKQVGVEFPDQKDEHFEMTAGVGHGKEGDEEAQPYEFDHDEKPQRKTRSGKLGSLRDPWGSKKALVDKTEHNVRASKLPEDFRKSFQPGLTPEMIFGMETLKTMQEANEKAAAVPAAVIASHKALKMMGVNEADVQKPFSEPVTSRIERLAKAAEKQGLMSGGATANLGNQIAEQFEVKRKAAEARAEAMRQAQLKKEEERIRQEISRENKAELTEKRRTLRESGKLSADDAKRLSLAAAARRSAKAAGNTAAAAGNRLKDFLDKAEGGS